MPEADSWQPYRPPPPGEDAGATDDEAALWQRWLDERDETARLQLVERYSGYAKAQAGKLFAGRPNDGLAFEEYRQFAMVGLIEAVDRYRPERGARFTTYATPRIRGAILSGLQHLSEFHEQLAWRRRVMRERAAALAPDAFSGGASPGLLQELMAIASGLALGALLEGTGMIVGPKDGLPGNAYADIELRQLRDQIRSLLPRLTERERDVVQLHYMEEQDFDAVAARLNLSKGRVSQLHRQALARLRELIDKSGRHGSVYL